MKNLFALAVSILLFTSAIYSQATVRLKGTVKSDAGNPLAYVNVYIEKSTEGAMTNEKGEFSFLTKKHEEVTMIASMIGYKSWRKNIELKNKNSVDIEIVLSETVVKMKATIVTGSSYSSEAGKGLVVSPVDVYTTPGGAADVFQSIKKLPGLTSVSESAQLYVRGGDPVETITMIDGAPMYHPFTHESSYGGLFSNLNTGTFKGLYFSSGGFSAKYGNVLSGVLDVQTKSLPMSTSYSVGVSMAAAALSIETPLIEDKFGVSIHAQKSFTQPLMWMNGGESEFTTTPNSENLTSTIGYRYSKTGMLKLISNFATDKQGVKVDRAEYNGDFNSESFNNFLNLVQSDLLFDKLIMKNSLSFNGFNNNWNFGILDLEIDDKIFQLRSDLEYQQSKSIKLLAGFEVSRRTSRFKGSIPEEDYDIRPEAGAELLDSESRLTRAGGYFELENIDFLNIENLYVIGGVRTDYFSELDVSWVDPRLSIGYKINEKSTLKFGSGIFHQLPDIKLYRSGDGNPELNPMQAVHFILSYDYQLDSRNSFRIEVYNKKYNDLPQENEILNYNNDGYGYARGIDLIFKGDLPFDIDGWISYGYIDTKRKWMDYEKETRSDYDISHNLNIVAKYNLTPLIQIGVSYKLATGRPYTPVIGSEYIEEYNIYEPIDGATNTATYPTYNRLDLRLSFFQNLFGNKFSIFYIEALNILNIKNLFGYYYNSDYSQKEIVESFFGRRIIVIGSIINF